MVAEPTSAGTHAAVESQQLAGAQRSAPPAAATGAEASRWRRSRQVLDPLAVLLRARFASRAELSRASGLGYQTLRTYTDGRWTAASPPPTEVLEALARTVDRAELDAAVLAARHAREAAPELSWGQRVVLEALRGFDDEHLVAAAPHVYDLVVGLDPKHR